MKTVSEMMKEHEEAESQRDEAARQMQMADVAWIEKLEKYDIPVHVSDWPGNRTNYADYRTSLRMAVKNGQTRRMNLKCDHCNTQIVETEPGCMTLSNPPQKKVGCPGCGWIGWVPYNGLF